MKSLKDYINESERLCLAPNAGDEIDFEVAPGEIVSTYVVESTDDTLILAGDDYIMEMLSCIDIEEEKSVVNESVTDVPPSDLVEAAPNDFARIMELAGCRDMEEDQSAEVLAQKELAQDITNPMPGVHEEEVEEDYDVIVSEEDDLDEAEYQGRKVPLGKPMRGDVKKFKVYVKDPKTGNVKKVNFGHGGTSAKRAGQKTMKIKKSDPARRRSFRARHRCDTAKDRTTARYWSCRMW